MNKDRCEYCDGTVEEVVTRVSFRYQRETVYVDNVPVDRCDKCSELYFPAKVVKELERIAAGRKTDKQQNNLSFGQLSQDRICRDS
jgi:YgiT-type zinc finger domain-containing protein